LTLLRGDELSRGEEALERGECEKQLPLEYCRVKEGGPSSEGEKQLPLECCRVKGADHPARARSSYRSSAAV
jgi:hypothetical protein